jgi:hypothetical protein
MNELDHASLEASKKLVDAGIVLETEKVWFFSTTGWELVDRYDKHKVNKHYLPAPSMAEVWRELPETIDEYDLTCEKIFNGGMQAGYTTYDVSGLRWKVLLNAANPTDAMIDLLIFVRKGKP